jgi:hypothetical protein
MTNLSILRGSLVPLKNASLVGTAEAGIAVGMPLYKNLEGGYAPAQAVLEGQAIVVGMALNGAAIGADNVQVLASGPLSLSQGPQISAIVEAGSYAGDPDTAVFNIGVPYYLSATQPGKMTLFPPEPVFGTAGTKLVQIGIAIEPTILMVQITQQPGGDGLSIQDLGGFGGLESPRFSAAANVSYAAFGFGGTYPIGAALYVSGGNYVPAIATSLAASSVVGLSPIANGGADEEQIPVVTAGELTLTTAEWDAIVTGESGGLTTGSYYYLSGATAGFLTTEPPVPDGQWVLKIGLALSPTTMLVQIGTPIENVG